MQYSKKIENIVLNGTKAQKLELFSFDFSTNRKMLLMQFIAFATSNYSRYFNYSSAPFHDDFIKDMIESYFGENKLIAAFRGSAKTSLKKLFDVFVLLNDKDHYRKYIKVLTRDGKNSRQIVTDVYNLIVEVKDLYGDVFEKQGDIKHEETMSSFTLASGVKYSSGTVGQTQRGHVQDAYRPDWIWFEDVEDRDSVRSAVITGSVISKCGEAIDGLSINGSYLVTCNYISDQGTIQWFMNKPSIRPRIVPLLENDKDNRSATWSMFTPEKVKAIREDVDDFYGEFQCDPAKSDNRFFDYERIENDLKKCKDPIRESAGVKYWANYLPHHRYGAGSDHSEGVGLDANTLALFDFTTGELVVTYANNKITPDLSVHEFARVSAEFGNCIYAPETNNKCGGTAITTLKSLNYPNIYSMEDNMKRGVKVTEKLGWDTNSKTKYNMFYEFRKDYHDGLIKIYDSNVLKEMKVYANSDLSETNVGLVTRHFDLLTATVIAWQMRKKAVVVGNTLKSYNEAYKEYLKSV